MIYRLTESTLDGALTDSATTVNVDLNTAGLGAAANSYILIGSEVLLVTAVSTNALTVTRGQHGTAPSAHLDGAKVFLLKDTLDHTMEIDSTYVSGVEVVAPRPIDEANAIGDGCKSLGFCTGKGECDHCTSTCRCPHAHSAVDNSYTSYSCEAINCPTGMVPTGVEIGTPSSRRIYGAGQTFDFTQAWADLPWHPGGAGDNTWAHYRRLPCSGAGLCTAAGKCSCFANFFGPACERRVCPGGSAETGDCSGHGTCATMKQLSMLPNALPLSKNNVSGYHAGDHVPYYEHHAHGRDDGTWDAMRLYGCVCDSSWPVGLGALRRGTRLSDHGLNGCLPHRSRRDARARVLRADLRGAALSLRRRPDDGARRDELHGRAGQGGSRRRRAGEPLPRRLLEPRLLRYRDGAVQVLQGLLRAQLPLQGRARRADRDLRILDCILCSGFARASRFK